jgi:hypothetical protein
LLISGFEYTTILNLCSLIYIHEPITNEIQMKSKVINFRVTPADKSLIEKGAENSQMTQSEFIRFNLITILKYQTNDPQRNRQVKNLKTISKEQ